MEVLTLLFELPVLPFRGLLRLAEIIRDEVDRQMYDPAVVRRQLEDAAEARAAGQISEKELAEIEAELVGRLTGQPPSGSVPDRPDGDGR